ncbi:MAG: DUF6340 family protein [Bacteroidales bacterium]
MIRSLLFALLALALSSCQEMLFITKTYPPEIETNNDTARVIIMNRFDYNSANYIKDKNQEVYKAGVDQFSMQLLSLGRGQDVHYEALNSLYYTGPGKLTLQLPPDSVISLCSRNGADMLLTVDSLQIYFDWETIVEDDGASKSKTKNFYLHEDVFLTVYSSAGINLNRSRVGRSMLYKSRPTLSGLITFQPSLPKAIDEVKILSTDCATEFNEKFYPLTQEEPRMIYSGKKFRESNKVIKSGDYTRAGELLREMITTSGGNLATKARHNLIVVQEAMESKK